MTEPNQAPQEIISCIAYRDADGKQHATLELDKVSEALAQKGLFVWIGLYEPSDNTLDAVQQAFGLHELSIEDASVPHQRAKVETYGNDCAFIIARTAVLDDTAHVVRYGTTSLFFGEQYVVVVRRGHSQSHQTVRAAMHNHPERMRLGPVSVVHAVLDFIIDSYLPITEQLGRYLHEQEQMIFAKDFSKSTLKELYHLKSEMVRLKAVILPHQDICNFFINHKKDASIRLTSNQFKPYFRDVHDHVLRALDAVTGLSEMLSVAMDTYTAVVSMEQNLVVRKLAAWAGILAVPTMFASFYGMNFEYMPELKWRYSYEVFLVLMLGLAFFLWRTFKRIKWL